MPQYVLVCNGLSASGFVPPEGAYVVTLNGGFMERRANAAVTVDCPGHIRGAWAAFTGERVLSKHMPEFPQGERFECYELVRKFASATPVALAWLAQRKQAKGVTVVGLDSLWGAGKPGMAYNRSALDMISYMAQYFPEGITVQHNGQSAKVGTPEFMAKLAEWSGQPTTLLTAAPAPWPEIKTPPEKVEAIRERMAVINAEEGPEPKCTIPQVFVELDPSPRCTRACSFCAPGIPPERRKLKKAMSLKAHNAFLDELAAVGFNRTDRWLCYCGHGEPLLNKDLFAMIRYARKVLPRCTVSVYTNGDPFTEEIGCTLAALDVDYLFWDVYDTKSGVEFPAKLARSSYDPARVRVVDHISGHQYYTSRCSSVKPGNVAEWIAKPCGMPGEKIFVTDDGSGGAAFLLCCDNLGRESLKVSSLKDYVAYLEPITENLKTGKRTSAHEICRKCDRNGNCGGPLPAYPPLPSTRFWPPVVTPPKTAGRRLVVLPSNGEGAKLAELVLSTIKRASNMDGETLLLWNDNKKCPDNLRALANTVWESGPLGWCGISRGIAKAFRYAVKQGFDWVVKLDTDTAIMAKGWDSALCADCPPDAQAGTYMDETLTGGLPRHSLRETGLFNRQLERRCRWARDYVKRGLRGWGHMQGGCYVIGLDALKRIDRVIGLGAEDQEGLPEGENVGEDVYIDTKCKVAGVRQVSTLRSRSWYRKPPDDSLLIVHVQRQRDTDGVVAVHPIKNPETMRALAEGIR